MTDDKYFASEEVDKVELERLELLHQLFDPITVQHMEQLRIQKGWNCLDAGAGGGSIARWLAERTGTGGKVVATDTDTRFLNLLDLPNLEVRKHDIVNDEIEEGYYDLVHCRFLLMHLNQYQKALEQMAKAVRPGGWLLIEELDYSASFAINPDNPITEKNNKLIAEARDKISQLGIIDFGFGCQVRGLIDNLQLLDTGHDGITPVYRGGETMAIWDLMNRQTLIRSKIFDEKTKAEAEKVNVILEDPSYYFTGATIFSAWGKKP